MLTVKNTCSGFLWNHPDCVISAGLVFFCSDFHACVGVVVFPGTNPLGNMESK